MTESERIAEQMRRMMFGVAWHGPAVLEALDGVPAAAAAAHPVPGAHSIWELAVHLAVTQRLVLARIAGQDPVMSDEAFFPPVTDPSDDAWKKTVDGLKSQEEELIAAVRVLPAARLAAPLPDGTTAYETFHGHAQHNAFHAGQIKLLRKALGV